MQVKSFIDVDEKESEKVLLYAHLNSHFQLGFNNPIDEAILTYRAFDVTGWTKIDEIPYDFIRKRLSISASIDDKCILITKGALSNVLSVCTMAEKPDGTIKTIETLKDSIEKTFEELSAQGFRTIGVAYRALDDRECAIRELEKDMTFLGFIVLFDPPKEGIVQTIERLRKLAISLKVITGDNHLVAAHLGKMIGPENPRILTGTDLHNMLDEALMRRVNDIDIFAEVEPNQKERIILALKKAGNIVGYMGDGINDAPALHAADVSISVEGAVDVAKESADFVLLERDINVLANGVREGRKTFSNTLKYVFMATSANFGNMFSMAGASLFLSFLPLLPKQILLTNLLTDFPEMAIASDNVDEELLEKPRRWNIAFIRNFMIVFGIVSSIFDYMTFGALLFILHAGHNEFRCGWFTESVISAVLVVLVIRSQRPFFMSRPGKYLAIASAVIIGFVLLLPFLSLGRLFGFSPLPFEFYAVLFLILVLYILFAEIAKRIFYSKVRM